MITKLALRSGTLNGGLHKTLKESTEIIKNNNQIHQLT